MSEEKKKLGILLFSGPQSQDVGTAVGLASAALKRGMEVEIFMMYEAVLNTVSERLKELCERGAKVTLCTHNADELKAHREEGFSYGSQFDHSYIVNETDRYVAFG
ncbi:MAG: hypothetical protein ACE5EN_08020 [Nitrospinota bacterium]